MRAEYTIPQSLPFFKSELSSLNLTITEGETSVFEYTSPNAHDNDS